MSDQGWGASGGWDDPRYSWTNPQSGQPDPNYTPPPPPPTPAAPAPAPAAPAGPPADPLANDPTYQAFARALGLQETGAQTAHDSAWGGLESTRAPTLDWMSQQNDQALNNIAGGMEARGMLNSGETNNRSTLQRSAYSHQTGDFTTNLANQETALDQVLAQQKVGFGTQDAEQRAAATQRIAEQQAQQQLAAQQAAYQQQMLQAQKDASSQQQTFNDALMKAIQSGGALPTPNVAANVPQQADASLLSYSGMPSGGVNDVVKSTAQSLGLDPRIALADMQIESGGNPRAVGDNGSSYGLFQLHRGGELGSLTPDQAFDPATNARTALSVMAQVAKAHPGWSPGQIAAAAERPADPAGYAAKVDAIFRQLFGSSGSYV